MPIAKDVFLISSFRSFAGITRGESPESISKIGKSLLGSVDSEYLPLVVLMFSFSPLKDKFISSPSGIKRQSSFNFLAEVVVLPADSMLDNGPLVVTSDSKSVAVNLNTLSSTSNKTLASIGSVCLFSTTPKVVLRAETISSFLTVISI